MANGVLFFEFVQFRTAIRSAISGSIMKRIVGGTGAGTRRNQRNRSGPLRQTIKAADSRPRPARAPRPSATPEPATSTFEDGEGSVEVDVADGGAAGAGGPGVDGPGAEVAVAGPAAPLLPVCTTLTLSGTRVGQHQRGCGPEPFRADSAVREALQQLPNQAAVSGSIVRSLSRAWKRLPLPRPRTAVVIPGFADPLRVGLHRALRSLPQNPGAAL
jgi:hypothetical protein